MSSGQDTTKPINTARQVLFASLIGTTIEFFDFYIYATAAVIVWSARRSSATSATALAARRRSSRRS